MKDKRIFCITYVNRKLFNKSYVVECYFDEDKAIEGAKIYQLDYDYEDRDYYVERTVLNGKGYKWKKEN